MKIYRQGDVLLIKTENPEIGEAVPLDKGKVVLAYGEISNHSHALGPQNVYLFLHAKNAGEKILKVEKETALLEHEEHSTIPVPPGDYIVRIQREYTPERVVNVRD